MRTRFTGMPRTALAFLLFHIIVTAAAAQDGSHGVATRTGWLPRSVGIGGNLTAAQRAAAISRLEQIERILLQVPELAEPQGFEILPQFWGGSRQNGPGQSEQPGNVIEYMIRLSAFRPSKALAGEGAECIAIRVNAGAPVGPGAFRDEEGRGIYIELPRGDPLPLATQVYNGLSEKRERSSVTVLLTSAGELPWRTVTREEYYEAVILDRDGKNGSKITAIQTAMAKTRYQEWMEGAAERKKIREDGLRTAAAVGRSAEDIAKMRKQLEESERQLTEQFKASESDDRERQQKASVALGENKARDELDAMSAAERNMPALINSTLSEGPNATGWRMTDRDEPPATWRVLMPVYDFWRARKSPVEVRSLTVQLMASATCLSPPVHNALLQTWRKLDWAALNRLLDMPR